MNKYKIEGFFSALAGVFFIFLAGHDWAVFRNIYWFDLLVGALFIFVASVKWFEAGRGHAREQNSEDKADLVRYDDMAIAKAKYEDGCG